MVDTQTTQTAAPQREGFLVRHWQKLVAAVIWLTLAGSFLAYSLITGKTPWLACLPWAHVCLLAGFGVAAGAGWRRAAAPALGLLAAAALACLLPLRAAPPPA